MIESILWIVYGIGWVTIAPWYILRMMETMGGIDVEDYIFAAMFTLIGGWMWPGVLLGRLAYIGWVRYIPPFSIPILQVKEIEPPTTYRERQAAKLDKREEELAQREAWVRERELT